MKKGKNYSKMIEELIEKEKNKLNKKTSKERKKKKEKKAEEKIKLKKTRKIKQEEKKTKQENLIIKKPKKRELIEREKELSSYFIETNEIKVKVRIMKKRGDFTLNYVLEIPKIGEGTRALLDELKNKLIINGVIKAEKLIELKELEKMKKIYKERATKIIEKEAPGISDEDKRILIGLTLQEMLGIGRIEFLLNDAKIEEIAINNSKEEIWVYHKEFGWLKTTEIINAEEQIHNYASIIARRIGKQITILNPLLDAHLQTGDRVNATLFPISGKGNTITIRKFRREPWTITDFIENNTLSAKAASLIWLTIQFELNIIISGGTASGKTTLLNVCLPFIQPNHRIVTIEDTRELNLPKFLHWVPLTTRSANIEGKGEIKMIDLMVNSLRMRPDRIIIGEIRREKEVEVMFEAMHTGHSVYTTLHANTAIETIRRLENPPLNVPTMMLESVHLNLTMYRNRRTGIRRLLEMAEFIPEKRELEERIKTNSIYRLNMKKDKLTERHSPIRLFDELMLVSNYSEKEIQENLKEKENILNWMVKNKITGIKNVGKVIANYYGNKQELLEIIRKNKRLSDLIE